MAPVLDDQHPRKLAGIVHNGYTSSRYDCSETILSPFYPVIEHLLFY